MAESTAGADTEERGDKEPKSSGGFRCVVLAT